MKIEEIQQLIKDEDKGRLRIPAVKENTTKIKHLAKFFPPMKKTQQSFWDLVCIALAAQ